MTNTRLLPIEVTPGVQTVSDFTTQSTPHYVDSDKVRFIDGYPEKIGGWKQLTLSGNFTIQGCPRSLYSYVLANNDNYLIGTHTNLYYVFGNTLTNITPVETSSTSITSAFSTFYGTLANDPVSTVDGSTTVTITDAGHKLASGDFVTLSGSTAVGGVSAGLINATHAVSSVTANTYSFTVGAAATSAASGGGAAVVRATRILTVTQTAHGLSNGQNIVISNTSGAVGGIAAGEIDGLRVIRGVTTNTYDIEADGTATSSVSNQADADIQQEIAAGLCDPTTGSGYGLGLYGVGLYGVAKSASSPTPPSIYSFDRFGDNVVFTRGTQTGLYSWATTTSTLPALVSNAPAAINYVFTSNEIVVTLGASNTPNRVQWSDQGSLTIWTGTAQNQAGQDDVEGAGEFISHAALSGFNLLFTKEKVYTFRYINRPFVWETKLLDPSRGLIAQNARIVVNGVCYWMGQDNFYEFRGGNVEILRSNTTQQTTLKKKVFENINRVQAAKIYAWYNEKFNEIWWHYPSDSSSEPNNVAVYNINDRTWAPMTLDRTAAEYPTVIGTFPYLADESGFVYTHENGTDDVDSALSFSLETRYFLSGDSTVEIQGLIPDSIQTGDVSVTISTKAYAQSSTVATTSYTVQPDTEKLSFNQKPRYWNWKIEGSELGQSWRSGQWMYLAKGGTPL